MITIIGVIVQIPRKHIMITKTLFHKLWTECVHTPSYNKATWKDILFQLEQNMLISSGETNSIVQHIPNSVDGIPSVLEFETTEELISSNLIKQYVQLHQDYSLVMSDNILMILTQNGFKWWAIGRIRYPNKIKLPAWEGPKYLTIDSTNHYVELMGKDIKSISGNVATLIDESTVEVIRS